MSEDADPEPAFANLCGGPLLAATFKRTFYHRRSVLDNIGDTIFAFWSTVLLCCMAFAHAIAWQNLSPIEGAKCPDWNSIVDTARSVSGRDRYFRNRRVSHAK